MDGIERAYIDAILKALELQDMELVDWFQEGLKEYRDQYTGYDVRGSCRTTEGDQERVYALR